MTTSPEHNPISPDSPLDRLLKWETFGGHWRVIARTATRLEIRLLTCDGGEEADGFETGDEDVLRYIGARMTDQDDVYP
jgi:hypothetical protein